MPKSQPIQIHAARNPDNVLKDAVGGYQQVFIIGYDLNGNMDARSSTNMTYQEILWLLDAFRHKLLNGDYFDDE